MFACSLSCNTIERIPDKRDLGKDSIENSRSNQSDFPARWRKVFNNFPVDLIEKIRDSDFQPTERPSRWDPQTMGIKRMR